MTDTNVHAKDESWNDTKQHEVWFTNSRGQRFEATDIYLFAPTPNTSDVTLKFDEGQVGVTLVQGQLYSFEGLRRRKLYVTLGTANDVLSVIAWEGRRP